MQLFKGLSGERSREQVPGFPSKSRGELDFKHIIKHLGEFRKTLAAAKQRAGAKDFAWYPYDSLTNFFPLQQLLSSQIRFPSDFAGADLIVDICCGDGDVSFFLESLGCSVEAIDYPPTNYNHMLGVRALKSALGSAVEIFEMDLDGRFALPRERYGLALLFGALYHLKNPFYLLETLAKRARYCLLSTRIARFAPDRRTQFRDLPVAYLLDAREANGDATNYWIFSEAGLKRVCDRAGWQVEAYTTTGDTVHSDPAHNDADERAFCLLKSRHF